MALIDQARRDGARLKPACTEAGIDVRTYQRWKGPHSSGEDGRPGASRPAPVNKLTQKERAKVLETVNAAKYQSLPPGQIVPKLADQGVYLASESTMYRILREEGQANHRGRRQKPSKREPATHAATGPNQVWMWDITWLKGPVKGMFYRLYLIQDLFSRKIVGWEIHEEESGEHAKVLVSKAVLREKVAGRPIILHADNGSPMKAAVFLETLRTLGLKASYSRPRVSNDNAYVERLFGTLKYRPNYPSEGFDDLRQARAWAFQFVQWYNQEHQHRSIGFTTPNQCHQGEADEILRRRKEVYRQAKARTPQRWTGPIRNWSTPQSVALNPLKAHQSKAAAPGEAA